MGFKGHIIFLQHKNLSDSDSSARFYHHPSNMHALLFAIVSFPPNHVLFCLIGVTKELICLVGKCKLQEECSADRPPNCIFPLDKTGCNSKSEGLYCSHDLNICKNTT